MYWLETKALTIAHQPSTMAKSIGPKVFLSGLKSSTLLPKAWVNSAITCPKIVVSDSTWSKITWVGSLPPKYSTTGTLD